MTIQLRDGGKRLRLLPWMNVLHLPEYGIWTPDSVRGATEGGKDAATAAAVETGASARRRSSSSGRGTTVPPPSFTNDACSSGDGGGEFDATGDNAAARVSTPRVLASNHRAKKDVALDSLFPPTAREILGSVRYLSEAGTRLVMQEVDDCKETSKPNASTIRELEKSA
jgi:hypothetical protein